MVLEKRNWYVDTGGNYIFIHNNGEWGTAWGEQYPDMAVRCYNKQGISSGNYYCDLERKLDPIEVNLLRLNDVRK